MVKELLIVLGRDYAPADYLTNRDTRQRAGRDENDEVDVDIDE
jgi:hypothetical protein